MKKYKAGIIGCGRVAGLLEDDALRTYPCTHMGGYRQHEQIEVVACCSRSDEDVRVFAQKFSIPHMYTDYQEMLSREKLDLVSIAAYAPTRAEMTIAAAANGVRGIFCEKAMATSLAEADCMINACKKAGSVLMVNHTRRWDHHFIGAKAMIDRGDLGRVQSISGTFSGNLLHTGVHMFDAMIYFCGPVRSVSGSLIQHQAEHDESSGYKFEEDDEEGIGEEVKDEDGIATLQFENGVCGHVTGLGKKYFIFEIDIQGTDGRIRIGNGLFQYWTMQQSTHYTDFRELQLASTTLPGSTPPGMVLAVQDLVSAIESGSQTRCSGHEARHALECALAVYASHSEGNVQVVLPLKNTELRIASR